MTTHASRLLLLFALAAPAGASAQSTSSSAVKPVQEEPVALSPFVVDASGDGDGYRASSTLAGSRIKTDLKDVAASVSVLTTEFLDDLGAKDVAGAMAFVAGAENDNTYHAEPVAALGGANGYVGSDFGDNNNSSGRIRVRGLGNATTVINFIEVMGSTDRYNTERVEFLRGANSILFGLASPAGLVNSSTKIAGTRRNATTVANQIDDFGSSRVMLDHNQVLIPGKLAVRGVGLYNDQRYRVETAFLRDRRAFLTATYQPFKTTTLRGYFEDVSSLGRRPNNRVPQDNVSGWLKAYNTYAPRMTPAQIAQAFFWDPTVPNTDGIAPATTFTLSDGTAVNLGLIRRPLDTNALGTALIYSGNGQWSNPLDNVATIFGNRSISGAAATPASARSQFARSGDALENSATLRSDPQVTDQGIFPYDTVEIGALPGNYRQEQVRRFNLTLDQRITEDLYLSATVQRETRDFDQYFAILSQTNQISIDINQKLPDGRVNPNFLRPFIYGRNIAERGDATLENYLVQANYDFDFAKKTERLGWLGSHRLTGVYTRAKRDTYGTRYHNQFDSNIPAMPAAATGANATGQANRYVMQLWYVGDPVKVGDTSLRFTGFPDTVAAQAGRSYDYLYYNNLAAPAAWQRSSQPLHVGEGLIPNAAVRTWSILRTQGVGTSLQSFFWRNRLVTLLGWRQDKVDSFVPALLPDAGFPFPTLPGSSRSEFVSTGAAYKIQADTTTQSVVFKATDNLRLLANRSENFAATSPRQDSLYRNIPPTTGKTDEVGIGASFFGNRLDVKLTHYKSSQLYTSAAATSVQLRVPAFENTLYNALINAGRQSEWSTVAPGGGTTTNPYALPNGAIATSSSVSKGYALEVYFRPNRNWDFVASLDQTEAISGAVIASELAEFFAVRASFYKKYFDEGLRVDGTKAPTVSSSQLLRDNFANSVGVSYASDILPAGNARAGLSPYTAKLVGRYSFTEGRFKGLSVGTSLRWESGKVVGYGQKTQSLSFGGLDGYQGLVSDLSKEYKTGQVVAGGMMFNYTRRILNNRVRWKIQVNAQELFSATGLRKIGVNGDGSPIWAVSPPRSYELSNSFDF